MSNLKSLATMAAATSLFSSVVGAFDANSKSNMVVYWGQGPAQKPLSHFCEDPHIDIINVGFLNQFPDQTGGYPGTNFGNQCGDETYTNKDGSPSKLLSNCPLIGTDIKKCQDAGKKILLSLGGAIPDDQTVKDDKSAEEFALFLWNAFGPQTDDLTIPRPFGDAVIDGFDFDIESAVGGSVTEAGLSAGYSSLINNLRIYYKSDLSKTYYISGAPQCVVPDAHLSDAIMTANFDFLFVQFYNTPACSARAYFDHSYGGPNSDITFDEWVNFVKTHGANKKTKIFLGLPGSTDVVTQPEMYLNTTEARVLVEELQRAHPDLFGGVMIYEATASENNPFGGEPYSDVVKQDMQVNGYHPDPTSSATSSSSSTSAAFSSSSTAAISSPSSAPSASANQSSAAPYPISSASASPSGSAGSSGFAVPSGYTDSSGIAVSSGSVHSSGAIVSSGSAHSSGGAVASGSSSAPYMTGTAPHSSGSVVASGFSSAPYMTGTAPHSFGASAASSGASAGVHPSDSASVSSSIPYPVGNSTSPAPSGGVTSSSFDDEDVVSVTEVVVITSCGPSVTNCPAHTKPVSSTIVHVSTNEHGSSASAHAGGSPSASQSPTNGPHSGALSSVAQSPASSSPAPSGSTQEVVLTEIVTSYLTTCPVTQTITQGGSQVVQTGVTTSTVYSTITSTVCTKCVAPPTPASSHNAGPSSTISQSPVTGSPPPSHGPQETITTVIKYTTLTTCPVTNTVTSGGKEFEQVTTTVSTITREYTSTIVVPATSSPAPAASNPAGPAQSIVLPMPQGLPNPVPSAPVTSGSNNNPSIPAQNPAPGVSQPETPTQSIAQSPAQGNNNPAAPAQQVPANSPVQGGNQPAAPASQGTVTSSTKIVQIKTMTIIPVPANPSQTAKLQSPAENGQQINQSPATGSSGSSAPANGASSGTGAPANSPPSNGSPGSGAPASGAAANGLPSSGSSGSNVPANGSPSNSGASTNGAPGSNAPSNNGVPSSSPSESGAESGSSVPGNAAPFPAVNGTSPASPSGSASPSGQASPSTLAFEGAASKMNAGVFGLVAFVAAAVLLL